jgi:hypothetical protein
VGLEMIYGDCLEQPTDFQNEKLVSPLDDFVRASVRVGLRWRRWQQTHIREICLGEGW